MNRAPKTVRLARSFTTADLKHVTGGLIDDGGATVAKITIKFPPEYTRQGSASGTLA
jgi:hypothetical protein